MRLATSPLGIKDLYHQLLLGSLLQVRGDIKGKGIVSAFVCTYTLPIDINFAQPIHSTQMQQ